MLFRSQKIAERKQTRPIISGEDARQETQELLRAWRDLPGTEKEAYAARAKEKFADSGQSNTPDGVDEPEPEPPQIKSCLWDLNSEDCPISVETFVSAARLIMEIEEKDELPGYRTYCNALRDALFKGIFVQDEGITALKQPHLNWGSGQGVSGGCGFWAV